VPRSVVERFVHLPRRATRDTLEPILVRAGFRLRAMEEIWVDVFEAISPARMTAWARSVFGDWIDHVAPERLDASHVTIDQTWPSASGHT